MARLLRTAQENSPFLRMCIGRAQERSDSRPNASIKIEVSFLFRPAIVQPVKQDKSSWHSLERLVAREFV
jgi:hypothetical protein